MRVVIEVTAGPAKGRKTVLAAGQVLKVGRTEWADFAIPQDGHMSGVHMAIETDHAGCYVKDLGSTNGTYVNGRRLKPQERTALRSGDQVLAGQTTLAAQIQGEGAEAASSPSSAAWHQQMSKPAPAAAFVAPAPLLQKRRYTIETCDSGLTLCRGTVEDMAPADLAVAVCSLLPAYVIADFRKLGEPRPDELASPNYLFDWLDPVAVDLVSPVVVAQDELLSWPALIEQGWGNDALVCLFSQQGKEELLGHLRKALHKGEAGSPTDAIVGYCWPSVLAPLLSYSRPPFVRELLKGIDAVLVELPDLPDTWQLYGGKQVPKILDQLGFQQQAAEAVSADEARQPSE